MKIVVTHLSPDLDAITSVWLIKRFLPGWQDTDVEFVPAGTRSDRVPARNATHSVAGGKNHPDFENEPILKIGDNEIIHVDTGLGPLDHHQIADLNICGASRTWDFICDYLEQLEQPIKEETLEAVSRIVRVVVGYDHFQEVFRPEADVDYQDFSFWAINEGLQYGKPGEDDYYVEFGSTCLDYLLNYFKNKVWAERELRIHNSEFRIDEGEEGGAVEFETKYGKGLGVESLNESVVKLAQKKGYVLVVRKDKKRGHVSIKTLPKKAKIHDSRFKIQENKKEEIVSVNEMLGHKINEDELQVEPVENKGIDLTLAYEQLRKMDPDATWFLHVSKKMLLNGSVKNPNMVPTRLTLEEIVKVLENLYK